MSGQVLRHVLAAFFLFVGALKLLGVPGSQLMFENFGLPSAARLAVGSLEILGAVGLFVERTSLWAAGGLALLMLGVAGAHALYDSLFLVAPPVLVLGLLGWIAYSRFLVHRKPDAPRIEV